MSQSRVRNASCFSQANPSEEIRSTQCVQTPFFLFRLIIYFRLMQKPRAGLDSFLDICLKWVLCIWQILTGHVSQDIPLMSCIHANHFQQLVFPHYGKYRDLEWWVSKLAGLRRERLKDKLWALPCLPYLSFNQPKPLPSQQDFSLPRELCENWGRASGRCSTIAKK